LPLPPLLFVLPLSDGNRSCVQAPDELPRGTGAVVFAEALLYRCQSRSASMVPVLRMALSGPSSHAREVLSSGLLRVDSGGL
jgi:hypothetical protein